MLIGQIIICFMLLMILIGFPPSAIVIVPFYVVVYLVNRRANRRFKQAQAEIAARDQAMAEERNARTTLRGLS